MLLTVLLFVVLYLPSSGSDGQSEFAVSSKIQKRICKDDPYIFCNQSTAPYPPYVGHSHTSDKVCGLCSQDLLTTWLAKVSILLQKIKGEECSDLVVYGSAFGAKYKSWYLENNTAHIKLKDLILKTHNQCFFIFVLADDDDRTVDESLLATMTPEGLEYIVSVPLGVFPYTEMRRNTKVFKMSGHFIFSWSNRVIWQDAKFRSGQLDKHAHNYFDYFKNTIDSSQACAAYVGLPRHANTMMDKKHSFASHCKLLITASTSSTRKRNITDSVDELKRQYSYYLNNRNIASNNSTQTPSKSIISLDHGMIDGAFLTWDLRTDRCRTFIADFMCTWLDETQCYSDRDQLSFPYVMRSMELQEVGGPTLDVEKILTRDRVFKKNLTELPLVVIQQSTCHWYFKGLNKCNRSSPIHV